MSIAPRDRYRRSHRSNNALALKRDRSIRALATQFDVEAKDTSSRRVYRFGVSSRDIHTSQQAVKDGEEIAGWIQHRLSHSGHPPDPPSHARDRYPGKPDRHSSTYHPSHHPSYRSKRFTQARPMLSRGQFSLHTGFGYLMAHRCIS